MGDARNHPYEASTLRVTALPCNCNYNFLLDDKRRKRRGAQINFLFKRHRSGNHWGHLVCSWPQLSTRF